jgi:predicted esterase
MRTTTFAMVAWLCVAGSAFAGVFDVGGKRPQRVEVVGASIAATDSNDANASVMERALAGVWGELSSDQISTLRGLGLGKPASMGEGAVLVRRLRLSSGEVRETVEVWHDGAGDFFARRDADPPGKGVKLDRRKFEKLGEAWERFEGFDKQEGTRQSARGIEAATSRLDSAIVPSWWTVDEDQLSERFVKGRDTKNPGMARVLTEVRGLVRLPKGHDARMASGLLVFIHAAPDAAIPEAITAAADALGLVCASAANVGNDQTVADRLQRTLDLVETVRTRHLIDADRVYFTGLSGGGKITTHAFFGFPEVVKGGVPVVAISVYEHMKRADGKYYRGDFPKPAERKLEQLRKHRLACITGKQDGNYEHITLAIKLMLKDRLDVRLFDVPGMGHEFASAESIAEALTWVDEPAREARDARIAESRALLDDARAATDASTRRALARRAMDAAPWTEPAWDALDLLKQ